MICGNCGEEIPDIANFCRHCGAARPVTTPDTASEDSPPSELEDSNVGTVEGLRTAIATLQTQVNLLTNRIAALEGQLRAGDQRSVPTSLERTGPASVAPSHAPAVPPPESPPAPQSPAPATVLRPSLETRSPAPAGEASGSGGAADARASQAGSSSPINWEWLLGGNWLARIGILALIIGIGFFLKLAFDNQWIGETGRVLLGLAAGLALLGLGEFWRGKYAVWAQPVTGGGIAILYLSIFAAFALYGLISALPALGFSFLVTLTAAGLAIRYGARAIAVLGILGGFATPVFLSHDLEQQWALLGYVLVLDVGVLALATFRNWRWFTWLGLLGSLLLFGFWVDGDPRPSLALSQIGITLIFLIFVAATTLFHLVWRRPPQAQDQLLMLLNAGAYLAVSYNQLFEEYRAWMGGFTLLMAAFYGLLGYGILARYRDQVNLSMFAVGVALTLAVIAVPVQLSGPWVVVAWAVIGTVLVWLSFFLRMHQLRWFGLAYFAVALGWLLVIDLPADLGIYTALEGESAGIFASYRPEAQLPFLNLRMLSYIFLIGTGYVTAFLWWRGRQDMVFEWEGRMPSVFVLAASVITLWILSVQLADMVSVVVEHGILESQFQGNVTSLSLGGLWAIYALIAIVVGNIRGQPLVRIGGLALLAVTVVKAVLVDAPLDLAGLSSDRYDEQSYWLLYDVRLLVYLIIIGAAFYVARLWSRLRDYYRYDWEQFVPVAALAAANLLSLWLLSVMVTDLVFLAADNGVVPRQFIGNAVSLSLSALWAVYAAILVILGIVRQRRLLRVAGLVLLGIPVLKLFVYDSFELEQGYRVAAFIGLGALLVAGGFLYQRYNQAIRGFLME